MCYDLAIGIKPKVLKFYYFKSILQFELGWSLYGLGKHDEAINCYD